MVFFVSVMFAVIITRLPVSFLYDDRAQRIQNDLVCLRLRVKRNKEVEVGCLTESKLSEQCLARQRYIFVL